MRAIDVRELKAWMDEGRPFQLVDVREADEWAFCRLPGAELVPLSVFAAEGPRKIPRGGCVVLYCHHGVRSLHAASYLEQQGYADVVNLTGGIHAWSKGIDPAVPTY